MSEVLEKYTHAAAPLPRTMLRWHLYGAGLENMGRMGAPEVVEVPRCGNNELLVRQDACGLCFSDTKVIGLGEKHPRLTGRQLAVDPVTLGHEVSCTVVEVGEELAGRYHAGDRFIIQADVFYKGQSMAYGYAMPGGLAQYSVIGVPILEGDEGCYLLPLKESTGYVESALVEPWACVVSAYAQQHRKGCRAGGAMLVIMGLQAEEALPQLQALLENALPAVGCLVSLAAAEHNAAYALAGMSQAALPSDWKEFQQNNAPGGFDDILVLGSVPPEVVEGAAQTLADHGICNLAAAHPFGRALQLDIGRIHYNWHHYLGAASKQLKDAYAADGAELQQGGAAWFIGAGGPMGQMHVQRAVQLQKAPRLIVATDVDAVRLQSVVDRFGATARSRGIELVAINPAAMTPQEFDAQLNRLSEGRGFDDIVSLVPVASLIEHAAHYLAKNGKFNIFAGVARGTMAGLPVDGILQNGHRYLGSSGSSLADMQETLRRVESGELSTNASLAAIGGMDAAKEGLAAVKEGRFTGKTLIFPQIPDLPLLTLAQLSEAYPTVYAKLRDGMFWTQEAEKELLSLKLGEEEAV